MLDPNALLSQSSSVVVAGVLVFTSLSILCMLFFVVGGIGVFGTLGMAAAYAVRHWWPLKFRMFVAAGIVGVFASAAGIAVEKPWQKPADTRADQTLCSQNCVLDIAIIGLFGILSVFSLRNAAPPRRVTLSHSRLRGVSLLDEAIRVLLANGWRKWRLRSEASARDGRCVCLLTPKRGFLNLYDTVGLVLEHDGKESDIDVFIVSLDAGTSKNDRENHLERIRQTERWLTSTFTEQNSITIKEPNVDL